MTNFRLKCYIVNLYINSMRFMNSESADSMCEKQENQTDKQTWMMCGQNYSHIKIISIFSHVKNALKSHNLIKSLNY